jgi:opacity protein-like surface antigen
MFGSYSALAGPYVSATGGAVFLSDSDVEDGVEGEAQFDTGFGFTGAIGNSWDPMPLGTLRTELEGGFRKNDVDEISAAGVTLGAGDSDVRAISGMVNLALDLNIIPLFQPYVMGGVGVANIKFENDDLDIDDKDTVFAYQAGAGIGIPVAIVTVYGGYRFFATADPSFDGTDAEYRSHNVEVGVRLGF